MQESVVNNLAMNGRLQEVSQRQNPASCRTNPTGRDSDMESMQPVEGEYLADNKVKDL